MGVVPIKGLFETHLTVADLDRSVTFYAEVVGLELAHRVPGRGAAFFWLGAPGRAMLGLWASSAPMGMRLHIAFDVSLQDVEASVARLRTAGLSPTGGRGDPIDEPVVICWMPAASVYFSDPDGHSLEFIAMLDAAPHPEWGWLSLSEWRRRGATQVNRHRA